MNCVFTLIVWSWAKVWRRFMIGIVLTNTWHPDSLDFIFILITPNFIPCLAAGIMSSTPANKRPENDPFNQSESTSWQLISAIYWFDSNLVSGDPGQMVFIQSIPSMDHKRHCSATFCVEIKLKYLTFWFNNVLINSSIFSFEMRL